MIATVEDPWAVFNRAAIPNGISIPSALMFVRFNAKSFIGTVWIMLPSEPPIPVISKIGRACLIPFLKLSIIKKLSFDWLGQSQKI